MKKKSHLSEAFFFFLVFFCLAPSSPSSYVPCLWLIVLIGAQRTLSGSETQVPFLALFL